MTKIRSWEKEDQVQNLKSSIENGINKAI